MTKEFDEVVESITKVPSGKELITIELSMTESMLLITELNRILSNCQEQIKARKMQLEEMKTVYYKMDKDSMERIEHNLQITQLSFLISVLENGLKSKELFVNLIKDKINANDINIIGEIKYMMNGK